MTALLGRQFRVTRSRGRRLRADFADATFLGAREREVGRAATRAD